MKGELTMMTKNKVKMNKSQLATAIQKSKSNSFVVCDLHNKEDVKDIQKEIETLSKKGSISIVIIEN